MKTKDDAMWIGEILSLRRKAIVPVGFYKQYFPKFCGKNTGILLGWDSNSRPLSIQNSCFPTIILDHARFPDSWSQFESYSYRAISRWCLCIVGIRHLLQIGNGREFNLPVISIDLGKVLRRHCFTHIDVKVKTIKHFMLT